ncbi:MAG TPA: hypothetical protein VF138_08605 [Caulobacteraceae bacterium]
MSAGRIFVVGATLLVLAVLTAGVLVAGSPRQARIYSLDRERVRALTELSFVIDRYHEERGALPRTLAELAAFEPGVTPDDLVDPRTQAPYEYHPAGAGGFELCATFEAASPKDDEIRWRHEAGRKCFDFKAPKSASDPVGRAIVVP